MEKSVNIVGTGTIGEPLIGIFTDFSHYFDIDEVTFHKNTPILEDRARINHLIDRGAKLVTDDDRRTTFEELGHKVSYETAEAFDRSTVIIDCTPIGNRMKEEHYRHLPRPKGFLAQGSEEGFGKPYARGVNNEALVPGEDRFIQVVSCNTHNITTLVKTLTREEDGDYSLERGNFVCMRRANDISQDGKFIPSPSVGSHKDGRFGTQTTTWTSSSPEPRPRSRGTPLPLIRRVVPDCVPAGILSLALPSSVSRRTRTLGSISSTAMTAAMCIAVGKVSLLDWLMLT